MTFPELVDNSSTDGWSRVHVPGHAWLPPSSSLAGRLNQIGCPSRLTNVTVVAFVACRSAPEVVALSRWPPPLRRQRLRNRGGVNPSLHLDAGRGGVGVPFANGPLGDRLAQRA